MKLQEIKELSLSELTDQIKKSRLELIDLRMKFASRQLENPSLISKKREEIARLLTVETQKQRGVKTQQTDQKEETPARKPRTKGRKSKKAS